MFEMGMFSTLDQLLKDVLGVFGRLGFASLLCFHRDRASRWSFRAIWLGQALNAMRSSTEKPANAENLQEKTLGKEILKWKNDSGISGIFSFCSNKLKSLQLDQREARGSWCGDWPTGCAIRAGRGGGGQNFFSNGFDLEALLQLVGSEVWGYRQGRRACLFFIFCH